MKRLGSVFVFLGICLILVSVLIISFTFYPVISARFRYNFNRPNQDIEVTNRLDADSRAIRPVDDGFGIVIPKIGANSRVVADVDPYDSRIYQRALTQGVAHAKGTTKPGETGNMFLFSHSSVNFYEAARYNSVFYLISELEKDDIVYIFYQQQKYVYKVLEKKVVGPAQIEYLNSEADGNILTLMTCTPAGTTFKRLIVTALLQKD